MTDEQTIKIVEEILSHMDGVNCTYIDEDDFAESRRNSFDWLIRGEVRILQMLGHEVYKIYRWKENGFVGVEIDDKIYILKGEVIPDDYMEYYSSSMTKKEKPVEIKEWPFEGDIANE